MTAPDGTLTFAELARTTRRLAGRLAAEGVGVGVGVGLLLGRSRLGLPSLLAVWWLGATAVLADERHPSDRLNFVLRDAEAEFLIAQRSTEGIAPRRSRTINPETLDGAADGTAEPDPVVPDPDSCAYLIYTSGTTGWPKGVEVTYANLGAFLDALSTLELRPGGLGINAVSPAFDGWLWCTLLYLLHGQGVALVDFASRDGSGDLSALVREHKPTTVCLTPTLMTALEEVPDADVLVVAGEPCPPSLADRLAAAPRLLNVYGPTECTIAATWADTARGDDPRTIGWPLPGYVVYVLDEDGAPAAEGELHIGGPAVACGYRNRPELTAQRFVPDPFAGGDARMYRTGDLVRVRDTGELEFRGRADDQVKVRGFRIELGELERTVLELDAVRSAAAFVLPAGDSLGLAVTLVPDMAAGFVAVIRNHCARRLPEYLRPSTVDVLDALPVLHTGKVDREALTRGSGSASTGRAPESEREHQICQVWSELLDRAVTDVEANFFELGGHSLLAARAVGALRRSTGLPVSMRHLLAEPTAAALARELDQLAAEVSR